MTALEFLHDDLYILGIVIMFCMVQSVFGMGLLIFGTPTLIILDVPFLTCLFYLIPANSERCTRYRYDVRPIFGRNARSLPR